MQPIPYLFFDGNCREAMAAYAALFGSEEPLIMGFGDAPPDAGMPAELGDAVMHAALKVGDGWIYASDDPSDEFQPMKGNNVHLSFPTPEKAQEIFNALAEGGEISMPFEAQFWTPGFGALVDRFGIRWMISADDPEMG